MKKRIKKKMDNIITSCDKRQSRRYAQTIIRRLKKYHRDEFVWYEGEIAPRLSPAYKSYIIGAFGDCIVILPLSRDVLDQVRNGITRRNIKSSLREHYLQSERDKMLQD